MATSGGSGPWITPSYSVRIEPLGSDEQARRSSLHYSLLAEEDDDAGMQLRHAPLPPPPLLHSLHLFFSLSGTTSRPRSQPKASRRGQREAPRPRASVPHTFLLAPVDCRPPHRAFAALWRDDDDYIVILIVRLMASFVLLPPAVLLCILFSPVWLALKLIDWTTCGRECIGFLHEHCLCMPNRYLLYAACVFRRGAV